MFVCPKCNARYTENLKYCKSDGVQLIACSEEVYLPIAEIINESLSVIARLRADRLGVVYQAADNIITGRSVCLRLFHPGIASDQTFSALEKLGELLREELECADIVADYIVVELEDDRKALVSDFCPGRMFDEILNREAPLSPRICVSVLLQIAEILNVAHQAGFVHGGLTPENMIALSVSSDELAVWPKSSRLKLTDFGVGRTIAVHNPQGLKRSAGEMMVRNYSTYYAPEIFTGNADLIGVKADVYSLGALCYHMLSGRIPFVVDGAGLEGPIYIMDDPRSLKMLPPDLKTPGSLEQFMLHALSRDPATRQSSMDQIIEELQEIFFDLAVIAPSAAKSLEKAAEASKAPTGKLAEGEPSKAAAVTASPSIPSPIDIGAKAPAMPFSKSREKAPTRKLAKGGEEAPDLPKPKAREKSAESKLDGAETPFEKKISSASVDKSRQKMPTKKLDEAFDSSSQLDSMSRMIAEASSESDSLDPSVDRKPPLGGRFSEDFLHAAIESERTAITEDVKPYLGTGNIKRETSELNTPAAKSKTMHLVKKSSRALTFGLMFISAGFAILLVIGIFALAWFQPAVGSIVVTSAPTGAHIALDGRVIGQAPAEIEDVPAGMHKIMVSKDGFDSAEKEVNVVKNQTVALPLLTLQPRRATVAATGTPEDRIQEFERLAEEAYSRGDYITPENDNALYYTNAVLAINPNREQATALLGRVKEALLKQSETAQQKGDLATAQQIYSQLAEKFPDDKQIADSLKKVEAVLASRRGQLSQLLKQGEEAFSEGDLIDPASASAYYFAAQMLAIERGNSAAMRLRGRVKDAALKEAEALAARSDLKSALEKFGRLVRLFPEDKRIPGRIRAINDQLAQPQQQQNVISLDPRKRRETGLQKYASGDYAGAAADLEMAVKNGLTDSDTFYYLGLAEWKRGRVSDAIKNLNQSLDQNPSHVSSIAVLGQIAESRKETAAALAYYERASKAGGSAEYSLNFLQKKIELLKDELNPKEKQPDSFSAKVIHEHTFGSCSGTLEVNARGVRYLSSTSDHSFSVSLNGISDLNPSADKISLKADDKKYTFRFPDKNSERFRQAYYDFFRAGASK